jgi:hypothetical protein
MIFPDCTVYERKGSVVIFYPSGSDKPVASVDTAIANGVCDCKNWMPEFGCPHCQVAQKIVEIDDAVKAA